MAIGLKNAYGDKPTNCPICGMALEPRIAGAEEGNRELVDMTHRFWVSTVLALPVFVMAMVADLAPDIAKRLISHQALQWVQFVLATPVVLWGGNFFDTDKRYLRRFGFLR